MLDPYQLTLHTLTLDLAVLHIILAALLRGR